MAYDGTIYSLVVADAKRLNRTVAMAYKKDGEWVPISHAQLLERVERVSVGLYEAGIRKGDRVAILCESRPEWTILDLGTLGCSSALVPIYPTLTPDQVEHILRDSGARICVVADAKQFGKVEALLDHLPALEQIVVIDTAGVDSKASFMSFADLEARGAARLAEEPELAARLAAEANTDDLATLIYTSGTTGKQKGVMLTHRNFLANIEGAFDTRADLREDDVTLSYLPLSHIFERTAVYGFLHKGVAIYYSQGFERVAAEFKEVRPTVATSVPRLFEKMYEKIIATGHAATGLRRWIFDRALKVGDAYARATHLGQRVPPLVQLEYDLISNPLVFAKWREALGGRVRYFISGGAPLAPDLAYAFLAAGIPIYEGYGLTETSPVIAVNYPGGYRIGTVGPPLPNVEVKIAEDGEILARGPWIMSGYYNLEEQSADVFTEDGFFKTGDVGHLDASGYLVITDRKKDLLKTSGGKYVAPQPIENALKASSLISQAIVIGDRRKFCSALIVPNLEALKPLLTAKGIQHDDVDEMVRDERVIAIFLATVTELTPHLARFEQIKKVALLPRELSIEAGEITPTLKVKRRVVEERYKSLIDAMYEESKEKGAPVHA